MLYWAANEKPIAPRRLAATRAVGHFVAGSGACKGPGLDAFSRSQWLGNIKGYRLSRRIRQVAQRHLENARPARQVLSRAHRTTRVPHRVRQGRTDHGVL